MLSDKYRDPQGYVIAYDNAYRVAQAIAKDGENNYLRAKNAAIECCNIIEEGTNSGKLRLTRFETNALAKVKADLEALTDDADQFMSDNLTKFKQEVAVFRPENYGSKP